MQLFKATYIILQDPGTHLLAVIAPPSFKEGGLSRLSLDYHPPVSTSLARNLLREFLLKKLCEFNELIKI